MVLSFAAPHHPKVSRRRLAVASLANLIEQLDGAGEVRIPHGVARKKGQLCCHAATSLRHPMRGSFSRRLLRRRVRILVAFRDAFRRFESRWDRWIAERTVGELWRDALRRLPMSSAIDSESATPSERDTRAAPSSFHNHRATCAPADSNRSVCVETFCDNRSTRRCRTGLTKLGASDPTIALNCRERRPGSRRGRGQYPRRASSGAPAACSPTATR